MIKIITTGYYKVMANNKKVSQHSQLQKAIESAINIGNATISFPDKMTIETEESKPETPELISVKS